MSLGFVFVEDLIFLLVAHKTEKVVTKLIGVTRIGTVVLLDQCVCLSEQLLAHLEFLVCLVGDSITREECDEVVV